MSEIKYAKEIIKDIESRGSISVPDDCVTGEEYEKWMRENTPLTIVNEDGTPFDPPENPLKEKWEKLYPPTRYGQPCGIILGYTSDGKPIANYSCILCHEEKCPHSEYWKVPDEDKEVYEEYQRQVENYHRTHKNFLKVSELEESIKDYLNEVGDNL